MSICKELVSTDGITVGTMCGNFGDDEPWSVGVDAKTYFRQLDEALRREDNNETNEEDAWRR
jgi:hypothetical protein